MLLGTGVIAAGGLLYKPETPENGPAERQEAAMRELAEKGITEEQRRAYAAGISEVLHRTVWPYGNEKDLGRILSGIPRNLLFGTTHEGVREEVARVRDDAFRLYLGMPQAHESFSISAYQPTRANESKYYYAANGWFTRLFAQIQREDGVLNFALGDTPPLRILVEGVERMQTDEDLRKEVEALHALMESAYRNKPTDDTRSQAQIDEAIMRAETLSAEGVPPFLFTGVGTRSATVLVGDLGHVQLSLGKDALGEYLAYYDRFDFGQPGQSVESVMEASTHVVGKPFEIYDRMYFDRTTWTIQTPL